MHVEVRGQLGGIGFVLPPRELYRLNLGGQADSLSQPLTQWAHSLSLTRLHILFFKLRVNVEVHFKNNYA